MTNKLFRKRTLSQPGVLPAFFNLEQNDEDKLFHNLISAIKQNKNKTKNIRLRNGKENKSNNFNKSRTINTKILIKKKLESNINLSKDYHNFGGSFLFPDYSFIPGKKVLKDLKSTGVERAINKNFNKDYHKPNFIKKSNTFSLIKPRSNSVLISKYLNLIKGFPSNNNNLINKNKKKIK